MENKFETNVGTSLSTDHTLDFSDRLYRVAMAFIAVCGVVGAGWVFSQFGALPQNHPKEIQVSGEGKAYAKPDIAMISFGVQSEAAKSQDAVNQNNTKMNAVIKAIKESGVEDKDIQTTFYNLYPVYDYETVGIMAPEKGVGGGSGVSTVYPMPTRQTEVVRGYRLDQQVLVKIRNFDKINEILDKATTAGANTVGSLQFTVDNPENLQSEARAAAIAKAKEKANSMVAGTGLRLGRVVNISEGYGGGYPMPMYSALDKAVGSGGAAPNIQTGQQEVVVTITLTYQLR